MSKDKSRSKIWNNNLIGGCLCNDIFNCLYGTFFPSCALASAKSLFDGSDWCFNCVCFSHNPCLTRNYIRRGYGINGRIGISDCFITTLCLPCVSVQLLNEVGTRGPMIVSVKDKSESPWLAPSHDYSCIHDPCDFFMSSACCCFEVSNTYSQLAGAPLWFVICPGYFNPVTICQAQHLVRKSYGIGGNDCYEDCLVPSCLIPCPVIGQVYLYKTMAQIRAEINLRGRPENFISSGQAAAIDVGADANGSSSSPTKKSGANKGLDRSRSSSNRL